jgi:hypothetical protein
VKITEALPNSLRGEVVAVDHHFANENLSNESEVFQTA